MTKQEQQLKDVYLESEETLWDLSIDVNDDVKLYNIVY